MTGQVSPEGALARIRRVLRSNGAGRDGVVIDDVGNILVAHRAGVRVDRAFCTPMEQPAAAVLSDIGIPVSIVSDQQARQLFGTERSSRVFALAHPGRPRPLGVLRDDTRDLVVLDGVRLAGNIGAVIRTTVALGGSGLALLNSGLTSVYDRRLVRASRGLVFRVPVVLSTPAALVGFCEEDDIPVLTSSASEGMDVMRLSLLKGRGALVFGGERHGCSAEIEQQASARVRIPMTPYAESLNVSVAAGIVLNARSLHNRVGSA